MGYSSVEPDCIAHRTGRVLCGMLATTRLCVKEKRLLYSSRILWERSYSALVG